MQKLVTIQRFSPGDDEALLARGLRSGDHAEVFKVSGLSGGDALRLGVAASDLVGTVFIESRHAAIFGVVRTNLFQTTGAPWLLAHDDFERPEAALALAKLSRRMIDVWLKEYGRLENLSDPEHAKAIRYLTWLGFDFDWNTPVFGPFGHRLVRFWR